MRHCIKNIFNKNSLNSRFSGSHVTSHSYQHASANGTFRPSTSRSRISFLRSLLLTGSHTKESFATISGSVGSLSDAKIVMQMPSLTAAGRPQCSRDKTPWREVETFSGPNISYNKYWLLSIQLRFILFGTCKVR